MTNLSRVLLFTVCGVLLLIATPAVAQVRIVAHSDAPVFTGVGVDLETLGRLRFSTSVGFLPGGYVAMANKVLVPAFESQGYTTDVAGLVRSSIDRTKVWRTTAGWRPFKDAGFVFGVGYTLIDVGGEATVADLLPGTSGVSAITIDGRQPSFAVSATAHLLHAELGWTWDLPANLWLRTGVGMGLTVKANTVVAAQFTIDHPIAREAIPKYEAVVEQDLHDGLRHYAHPPHVTLALGWSL
jgi:hypothetical protein